MSDGKTAVAIDRMEANYYQVCVGRVEIVVVVARLDGEEKK